MSLFYSLFAALMIVGIFMGLCLLVLKSTRKFGIQLTIGCLTILLLMSLANRFIFKFEDEHEAAITPQTFHKIKEGMTYKEVKKIVGGKAKSESNLYAGSKEYVYAGKDGLESGSTVTLQFDDDELNFISETGLISKREDEQDEDEVTPAITESDSKEDKINDLVEKNLKNVSVDKIELNQDMSENKENQYIALVHLSFNLKNTPERAKKITQTYSEDLAARIGEKVKSVDQLIIFWKVPYLNDNAVLAKNSYVRSGNHFIIADQAYQPPLQ